MRPFRFVLSETDEVLVSSSGIAFAGALLKKTKIRPRLASLRLGQKRRLAVPHSDAVFAMIGLLVKGKPDFEAIREHRDDPFFRRALSLRKLPSEATFRQRIDQLAGHCESILRAESADMLARHAPEVSACYGDWVALDVDVSPFDNSGTKKEGVALTYKKVEGYAPIFAYLGEEGYLVHCELREGSQHCQERTPEFLDESIDLARRSCDRKLLVRMDAGNDAAENLELFRRKKVDFIVKRNLRRESQKEWLLDAQAFGKWSEPRPGKTVYLGSTHRERGGRLWRVVFEVVERTIDSKGQGLLIPEVDIATYWTSLKLPAEEVIALYQAHGTSEQFHSELKTDMDLERLPSGKFATNHLVLTLGLVAYNILRLCGQTALKKDNDLPEGQRMPMRRRVKRRRLRTVIHDMIYMAVRLTSHANRWGLSLWRGNRWGPIWREVYLAFAR